MDIMLIQHNRQKFESVKDTYLEDSLKELLIASKMLGLWIVNFLLLVNEY